ncbi:Stk1 family PASTA domain-containing Ser/Thr kinase [Microbacterium sp. zg-YB36]|uniref:Stk1 family PASTA domain-containing Ser/Thr kinase n=1 Tax=Microbacterium sp. zg-YB36 TaxID=2969407 RepID=UPI00214A9135|nr:Stk1 family PASTA domain-containing Ser/Thr kinase [Microbacterium sp. zg-YB36]MDL5350926.1 PASTA domain-containing protein [Microbacterium sp. zg-YB36]
MTTTQQQPNGTPHQDASQAKRKPWYLRWWVWVLAAVIVLGTVGNALGRGEAVEPAAPSTTSTSSAAPSVDVPDLTGVNASLASAELKQLGLDADLSAQDGDTVLRATNWEVVGTDPAAGTTVPAGATIIVSVVKTLKTSPLSEPDLEILTEGVTAGRETTVVGGAATELPSGLRAQAPIPATQLVAVAIDSADGRVYALFVTGDSSGAIEGPVLGVNEAATTNFDWGTAATPESPVGQFRTAVADDPTAAALLDKVAGAGY